MSERTCVCADLCVCVCMCCVFFAVLLGASLHPKCLYILCVYVYVDVSVCGCLRIAYTHYIAYTHARPSVMCVRVRNIVQCV